MRIVPTYLLPIADKCSMIMVVVNKTDDYIGSSSCLPICHNRFYYREFGLYNKIVVIRKIFFDSI